MVVCSKVGRKCKSCLGVWGATRGDAVRLEILASWDTRVPGAAAADPWNDGAPAGPGLR